MTTISDVFELKAQELTKKQLAHAEALSEMKNVEAEVQKLGHGKSWRRYLAQEGGQPGCIERVDWVKSRAHGRRP